MSIDRCLQFKLILQYHSLPFQSWSLKRENSADQLNFHRFNFHQDIFRPFLASMLKSGILKIRTAFSSVLRTWLTRFFGSTSLMLNGFDQLFGFFALSTLSLSSAAVDKS